MAGRHPRSMRRRRTRRRSSSCRRHNIRLEMIFDMIKFLYDLFRVCPCFLELHYEFISIVVSLSAFSFPPSERKRKREREKGRTGNTGGFFKRPTNLFTRPPTPGTNEKIQGSSRWWWCRCFRCFVSRGSTIVARWIRCLY